MDHYAVRMTFVTPLLGSAPLSKELYSQFVAAKYVGNGVVMPANHTPPETQEELDRIAPNVFEQRGRTGFLRDKLGHPQLADYMVRGFLKESWRANKGIKGSLSSGVKNGPSIIDRYVFVEPRFIWLRLPQGAGEDVLERPLRAYTPAGPRVALASSERLPTGTWCDIKIVVLAEVTEPLLREWIAYGQYVGIGQWRGSGGYGRFTATVKPYVPSAGKVSLGDA